MIREKRYAGKVAGLVGARAVHIGMGTNETWRGTSDVRVKDCNFVTTDESLSADEGDDVKCQHMYNTV